TWGGDDSPGRAGRRQPPRFKRSRQMTPAPRPDAPAHLPRPPAWRWLRAQTLVERRRRVSPRDDCWVRAAAAYLRGLARCAGEAAREKVARRFPEVDAAFALNRTGEPLRRAEVEARLLAGEDFAAVGEKCGLPIGAVARYHQVFFDVRDRLNARDFV